MSHFNDSIHDLFHFSGDIDRGSYWWRTITITALFVMASKAFPYLAYRLFYALDLPAPLWKQAFSIHIGKTTVSRSWEFVIFTLPLTALLSLSVLSLSVRRLRNRQRPVWLVVPMIVAPVFLHLGYWIFNLYHPFSVHSRINAVTAPGSWLYSDDYLFPRALIPLWNLLELDGIRFCNVFKHAMLENNTWPMYYTREALDRMGAGNLWHFYLLLLVPAAALSAWAVIELGILKNKT